MNLLRVVFLLFSVALLTGCFDKEEYLPATIDRDNPPAVAEEPTDGTAEVEQVEEQLQVSDSEGESEVEDIPTVVDPEDADDEEVEQE